MPFCASIDVSRASTWQKSRGYPLKRGCILASPSNTVLCLQAEDVQQPAILWNTQQRHRQDTSSSVPDSLHTQSVGCSREAELAPGNAAASSMAFRMTRCMCLFVHHAISPC